MTKINSSSLFHFTKRKSWLKNIITNGVKFSYSREQISDKENGIAIPMACFCDIPVLRTTNHKSRYGSYAIGIDKPILIHYYSPIINPVTYIHSENYLNTIQNFKILQKKLKEDLVDFIKQKSSDMSKEVVKCSSEEKSALCKKFVEESTEIQQFNDWQFGFNFISGLHKPYQGEDSKGNNVCYYDEREWRAFWPDGLSEATTWVYDVDNNYFKENKADWDRSLARSEDGYVTLIREELQNALTHIIVPKDSDIPDIIEHILQTKTIFGASNVTREDRLMLISRITSFERIENDY